MKFRYVIAINVIVWTLVLMAQAAGAYLGWVYGKYLWTN